MDLTKSPSEVTLNQLLKHLPSFLNFKGTRYCATTKVGRRIFSGLACAEYASQEDDRVWMDETGTVTRE